ncbi:MAG TPA: hypothetical protein VEM93_06940 [Actinomycetota bacterium]|nr:hypothetical protein [Actinomycetota bacterium]
MTDTCIFAAPGCMGIVWADADADADGDGDGDGAPDPIACSDEPLELQAAATRATPASIVAARAVDQRLGITVVVLLPLGHGGRGCHH